MIDWAGEFGASLASYAISFAWLCGSIWLALKLHERLPARWRGENKRGCIAGMLIFLMMAALLAPLFFPAVHILKSYSCRSADDYEMCMDPPVDY